MSERESIEDMAVSLIQLNAAAPVFKDQTAAE